MSGAQTRSGEDVTPTPQEAAFSFLPTEVVSDTEENRMLHAEQDHQRQRRYDTYVVDVRKLVIDCML
jgi:hypothetical protein